MSTELTVKQAAGPEELQRIGDRFPVYRSSLRGFVSYLEDLTAHGRCLEDPYGSFESFMSAARSYLTSREKTVSPATVAVDGTAIKKAIRELAKDSDLTSSAWSHVERELRSIRVIQPASVAIGREKVLSPIEVRLVIEGATERIGLMIEFLYATGTRINEALGIRLQDVASTVNGHFQIRVLGKRSKYRDLKVSKDLVERMRKCFGGKAYLFETRGESEKPYAYEYVTREIGRIGRRVLGKRISAHTLRHSFATRALSKTRKIKALSAYLGHASTSTTLDMYVHEEFSEEDLAGVWQELRE